VRIDYEKLGLKVGLEFHRQLDTGRKLFCECPPILRNDPPDIVIRRVLRPSLSELGRVDPAAVWEFRKKRVFIYEAYSDTTCLVELDEEPPHDMDPESLKVVIAVAKRLKSRVLDEIHTMRKIVIDGSNTTGFQRTALVAIGGEVDVYGLKVPIQTICLEEDAARKIRESEYEVVYRLDRFGIPLIEIATGPVMRTPEQVYEVAKYIGVLLKLTGKVKRGIGSIRQDLNISIVGGARVEIKGVQELELLPKIVEYEVLRQLNLIKITRELRNRGAREEDYTLSNVVDVTSIFQNTKCRVIRKALEKGGVVLALKLPKLRKLLGYEIQPGRRFATELADRARVWAGVKGLFHCDELPAYGISSDEVRSVEEKLGIGPHDGYILIAGNPIDVEEAFKVIIERVREAIYGIPEETRAANPDGTTHFMRPRPGAARMYPETDVRPVYITIEFEKEAEKYIPEYPDELLERLTKELNLPRELAEPLLDSPHLYLFERIVKKLGINPVLVASVLVNTLRYLKREGIPVDNISDYALFEVFRLVREGEISKEAVPEILKYLAQNPSSSVKEAIEKLGLRKVKLSELVKDIDAIVEEYRNLILERGERAISTLMGVLMKKYRGRVDGKVVYELLHERVRKVLEEKGV